VVRITARPHDRDPVDQQADAERVRRGVQRGASVGQCHLLAVPGAADAQYAEAPARPVQAGIASRAATAAGSVQEGVVERVHVFVGELETPKPRTVRSLFSSALAVSMNGWS